MKPIRTFILITGLFAGLTLLASAQPANPLGAPPTPPAPVTPPEATAAPPPVAEAPPLIAPAPPATAVAPDAASASPQVPPAVAPPGPGSSKPGELTINLVNASLGTVLTQLSDAAGLVIVSELPRNFSYSTPISVTAKGPMTTDEVVQLLSSALRNNGVAVFRRNRMLYLRPILEARSADLEIFTPYDPNDEKLGGFPDEVVTALIHVRYADATALVQNLSILLPDTATMTVNASANTLIMVATKADLKRMLVIINALDEAISTTAETEVVFLKNADASAIANIINTVYSAQSQNQRGQGGNPFMQIGGMMNRGMGGGMGGMLQGLMGGGMGGFGGGGGGGGRGGGGRGGGGRGAGFGAGG